jgi:hypothetical protein
MSLLDKGMEAVREDIERVVDRDPEMKKADKALYQLLETFSVRLGREKSFALELAIGAARSAEAWASFRVGVTEGLRLANEVRTLIGSESMVNHE